MKTAISIPDKTFDRVDARAKALGMSRSEFFFKAAEVYLDKLDDEDLTARINEALERSGPQADDEAREWAELSAARLADLASDDEW